MIYLSRLLNISLLSSCIFLQGCQSLKTGLGIDRDPPDEFAVLPHSQPLDMPPNFYDLPVPVPGQPRPQEVHALDNAKKQTFGTKPGHRSPGQEALLKMGGAHESHKRIRHHIDDEAETEAKKKKIPLLEMVGVNQPAGDIINPEEELQKLEEQGVSHLPPPKKDSP